MMARYWFCKVPPGPYALPKPCSGIFLKTSDGPHWERHWRPNAIQGPDDLADFISGTDKNVWAWHVARGGTNMQFAAEMAILDALKGVGNLAGVLLDVEPFPRYYWRGTDAQMRRMQERLANWPDAHHILSYDPRRYSWASKWLMHGAFEWLSPQVYWPAFGQTPEVALREAVHGVAGNVIPSLPADAPPDGLATAVAWCGKHRLDHALFDLEAATNA